MIRYDEKKYYRDAIHRHRQSNLFNHKRKLSLTATLTALTLSELPDAWTARREWSNDNEAKIDPQQELILLTLIV